MGTAGGRMHLYGRERMQIRKEKTGHCWGKENVERKGTVMLNGKELL